MQPYASKWIGRFVAMLIMAVNLPDASAAGFMPVEIRAFHQNGTVNVYKLNKDMLKTNRTLSASLAGLQNRPPDAALLAALGLPGPVHEYTHIAVSGFASNGTTGDVSTKVQSIYKADTKSTWSATTREEIVKTNSAPSWWLDDHLVADWKGRPNAAKGQGVIWTQTLNGQSKTTLYSPTNSSKSPNGWHTFGTTNLNSDGLPASAFTPHTIYKEGEPVPENVKNALGGLSESMVIQKSATLRFPNVNQVHEMRALAKRPLEKGTLVLDALPGKITLRDLRSNHIPLNQFSSWVGVRNKFSNLDLHGYRYAQFPSKAELKQILTRDSKDTVILIAHNSDGRLHLAGADGDITIEEISKFKRDTAPARAIVLLTCEGGTVNLSAKSLAEIMKANKLATAVYASPDVVDASLAPLILNELHMNTTSQQPRPAGLDEVMRKYNYTLVAGIYSDGLIG